MKARTSSSSSTELNKITSETTGEKDITFIVLQKNERSMNSSELNEVSTQEVEGYRWDALLINESYKAEIWRHNKDTYSWELEDFENKHGVGILLTEQ